MMAMEIVLLAILRTAVIHTDPQRRGGRDSTNPVQRLVRAVARGAAL
jgi:hypothetical protein